MHMVAFHKWDKLKGIVNRLGVEESMLTAYFDANRHHEEACGILYRDFPKHFTWQTDGNSGRKGKTPFSKLEESSWLMMLRENATFFMF
jgi:ATP-dependent DNA helicase PIF1